MTYGQITISLGRVDKVWGACMINERAQSRVSEYHSSCGLQDLGNDGDL